MSGDARDYADLNRTDIATYNHRGYRLVWLDKEKGEVFFSEHSKECYLGSDDMLGIAQFLIRCFEYCTGTINEIDHVEVN